MRTHFVLPLVALFSLVGCNQGQPRLYRVAIDESPLQAEQPANCYVNSQRPTRDTAVREQNVRAESEWVIWSGEGFDYLDVGSVSFALGHAPKIEFDSLIEGRDRVFAARRDVRQSFGTYAEQRTTQIRVTFDNYSFAPVGTIALDSQYSCAEGNCAPAPDNAQCSGSLAFLARLVEAERVSQYGNNP